MHTHAALPKLDEDVATTAAAIRDRWRVSASAVCISVVALLTYWRRGDILLYGDAVAHIASARRVMDSISPGLNQLGTVWLPLPHLLMIPFVAPLAWWRDGVAASVPSVVGYCFAVVGIFQLFREVAGRTTLSPVLVRAGAWLAAAAFAANPNLVYLQTTAMTEPLYLALFVWAVVFAARFCADPTVRPRGTLVKLGLVLCGASLTRYDGWCAIGIFVPLIFVAWMRSWLRAREAGALSMPGFTLFLILAALGPASWLAWNYSNTGNPLDFANGPYSAKGIEQRVKNHIDSRAHPGEGDLPVAASYYLHAAQTNLGEKRWGPTVFWAAVAGMLLVIVETSRRARPRTPLVWLLLWIPLPFYINSVAYGSVPIFTPFRWPYSYYNVRYGIEMLPAVAIFAAALVTFAASRISVPRARKLAFALAFVFVCAAYLSCYVQQPNRPKSLLEGEPERGPIAWREAVINARTRLQFERQLAQVLRATPPDSKILMYTGDHVGALQRAGIPLRRVVNESNYYAWRLASVTPAASADYVVTTQGDAVAKAVLNDPDNLSAMATIDVPGQPHAIVYRAEHPTTLPGMSNDGAMPMDHDMPHTKH